MTTTPKRKPRALTAAQLAARIKRDTEALAKKATAKPAPKKKPAKKPVPTTAAKRAAAVKPKTPKKQP